MVTHMGDKDFRSGYVSIIGRPNVGKSTLLNSLLGEKIAIVSPKPQTTRNRIVGIKTTPDAQIIFMDTPGFHRPQHKLSEVMVRAARESLDEVDLILFMVEPHTPAQAEKMIIDSLRNIGVPVFLLINKIDTIKKGELLPAMEQFKELHPFAEIIPISAIKNDGLDLLMEKIVHSHAQRTSLLSR